MSDYCVRCFNLTVKEGTCTNCGFTDSKIDVNKIAEAKKLMDKMQPMQPISESAVSRMAKTDEQEKAVRNLERSLNKINVKLDNTSMVGETFKAVVNHNKQSYHVSVDPMGKVVVHDRDINPRKVNELKSALGMEIPKDEDKKQDEPAAEEKAEGSKLFQKKDLKEGFTPEDHVAGNIEKIVDQAITAGLSQEIAGKFANFFVERFGKSFYDPSYTQEWIDRFKRGTAWDRADGMTRAAMQAAGLHEGIGGDEAPKANENPDSQLITDDAVDNSEINMTDYVAEYIDPAIKELGFERTNAHYIADGIMLYYAHRGDGRKLDIKVH